MELHNKLVDILAKGISLTEKEIQELNLYFNIFDIIEKEKIAFGNFLLSNLRSSQLNQVGDWDLRNHEYFRKIGICESIKRMYQNQQDINIALVYYIEGDGYQSEFPNKWSDAIKRAKEILKKPKCHYIGISNTEKMTVFFSSEEFTEMAKYYNGWFQTEKDHETFIESVFNCFKTKRPQKFEFNKINQNSTQSIDIFYKAAKFAAKEGLIKSLIPDGKDEFHFYHKKDKCQVSVFEEDGLISMTQDYFDGNSPDTDDINLSEFKKYLEIEDIYQDVDVYKNTMLHEMPFGFADPSNSGMVGQSVKVNNTFVMKELKNFNSSINKKSYVELAENIISHFGYKNPKKELIDIIVDHIISSEEIEEEVPTDLSFISELFELVETWYSANLNQAKTNNTLRSIDNFLSKFPDNATSWRQATDEIMTLYNYLKEEYNEITKKDLDAINPSNTKTPSGRNREYKKGIYFFLELMKKDPKFDGVLLRFYENWKDWFKN